MNRSLPVCKAVVATIVATWGLSTSEQDPLGIVVGEATRVTQDAVPHVEPVIAADPTDARRLVAAAVAIEGSGLANWTVRTFASADGGRSWTATTSSTGASAGGCDGDPWLSWGEWGAVYLSCLSQVQYASGRDRLAILVRRSDNGGYAWSAPVQVPFPGRGSFDHPVVRTGRDGLVVVAATFGLSSIVVSRSTDGGRTFSLPARYAPDDLNNNLASALIRSDGSVVFTYYTMSRVPTRALWAVTGDRGSFSERIVVAEHHEPWGFNMMAVDTSGGGFTGREYVTWIKSNDAGGRDIYVSRRLPHTTAWSAGVPLHAKPGAQAVRPLRMK